MTQSQFDDLLARLDERMKSIQENIIDIRQELKSQNTQFNNKMDALEFRIEKKIESVRNELHSISEDIEDEYVTKEQFQPVQRVVYGIVGLILLSFAGVLVELVIKKHN